MSKVFITTMGYAGAGKSYFAKQLAPKIGAVRLNSDSMRNSVFDETAGVDTKSGNRIVFGAIDYAANEILKAGYSIVYDAKCNRQAERKKNALIANRNNAEHITVWVQVPREIAIKRGESRDITLDQERLTLEDREKRNTDYLEEPAADEMCIRIDGSQTFDDQFASFEHQLKNISA